MEGGRRGEEGEREERGGEERGGEESERKETGGSSCPPLSEILNTPLTLSLIKPLRYD